MPSRSQRKPVRAASPALASPRLQRLARGEPRPGPGAPDAAEAQELCDLCAVAIPSEHRHLLDLDARQLLCVCRACSLLFDRPAAGRGQLKLVPQRRLRLERFVLSDAIWEQLRIPVDMAYFFHDSRQRRVLAYYPGPMGATESRLELTAWEALEQANPVLSELEEDVEALLVNRVGDNRRQWLVPIEDCYRLVAAIRTRWRGFSGGREVWEAIDAFFAQLDRQARSDPNNERGGGRGEETRWRSADVKVM